MHAKPRTSFGARKLSAVQSKVSAYKLLLSPEARWLTPSNCLTLSRIVLAPVFYGAMVFKYWTFAAVIFFVAALTDMLDGYLARLLSDHTKLGKILDPIADKVFLVSVFASLVFVATPLPAVPLWFFVLVLGREVTIMTGTYILLERMGSKLPLGPSIWGKLTTFLQIVYVAWLFGAHFCGYSLSPGNNFLLYMLSAVSIASLIHYVKIGCVILRLSKN